MFESLVTQPDSRSLASSPVTDGSVPTSVPVTGVCCTRTVVCVPSTSTRSTSVPESNASRFHMPGAPAAA